MDPCPCTASAAASDGEQFEIDAQRSGTGQWYGSTAGAMRTHSNRRRLLIGFCSPMYIKHSVKLLDIFSSLANTETNETQQCAR